MTPAGNQAVGIRPSTVSRWPPRRITATSLSVALATYSILPSGDTVRPSGLAPTWAPGKGAKFFTVKRWRGEQGVVEPFARFSSVGERRVQAKVRRLPTARSPSKILIGERSLAGRASSGTRPRALFRKLQPGHAPVKQKASRRTPTRSSAAQRLLPAHILHRKIVQTTASLSFMFPSPPWQPDISPGATALRRFASAGGSQWSWHQEDRDLERT